MPRLSANRQSGSRPKNEAWLIAGQACEDTIHSDCNLLAGIARCFPLRFSKQYPTASRAVFCHAGGDADGR
jgi:hypothetical protein